MKYIEKVILENFQSHKNSTITFNNQLNIIIGPSDSGKTAILRGIKWALYNEPSGDYFIKEGESYCSVTIFFSNSTKIKRYRSKSKNVYYLYDINNNEQKFEGFGTTVPQEIIDAIGIEKILLDSDTSSTINLSDQLEGPFLLSNRGSVRASSIGRLVGVDIVDESLRETLRDVRNLSNDKRHNSNKVLELEKELKEYDYLESLKNKIELLESINISISKKEQVQIKYKNTFDKFTNLSKEKEIVDIYINKLKDIHILDDTIKIISLNLNKYKYLSNQNNKFEKLVKDKKNSDNIVFSLNNIQLVDNHLENISLKLNLAIKIKKTNTILIKSINESIKLKNNLKKLDKLDNMNLLINKIELNTNEIFKYTNLNNKHSNLKKSLDIGDRYLKKLYYIDEINHLYSSLVEKIKLLNKLNKNFEKYNDNKALLNKTNNYLKKYKKSFKKDLNDFKKILQIQEFCPFCFSNIDNKKIEDIISHYN